MKKRIVDISLLSTVLLLATSCMVGPRYRTPCLPIQEEWLDTTSETSDDSFHDPHWWLAFEDETLNALVSQAYHQNQSLEISGIRVYEGYAQLAISIGEFFPQFQQLQASHAYNHLSASTANVPLTTSFHNYLFNFVASWEIDLWGKFRHGIEASRADLQGSIYNYRDVLRSLIGSLSQTYMRICAFNQKIDLLHDNVAIQERTLRIVETKHQLGQVTGLDVEQAKSLLDITKANLETQILLKRTAENFLCTLLGYAPFHVEECYSFKTEVPMPPNEPSTGIPLDIVRTRPDVRSAEQTAISQAHVVGIAESQLLPAFSLTGFFGWEAGRQKDIFDSPSERYGFNQDIAWNIFNYGRLTNNVRFQNAILQELLVNYQSVVVTACREVEDAINSYLQSARIADELEQAVQATARTLEISLIQYDYGAIEFLNVLTAQSNLVHQELLLVDARLDHVNSYIGIQVSLGRGWEFSTCGDFISPCTKKEMDARVRWNKLFW